LFIKSHCIFLFLRHGSWDFDFGIEMEKRISQKEFQIYLLSVREH